MFDDQPLLDSGIVNEETKNEIQEAWETKMNETKRSRSYVMNFPLL